MKQAWICEGIRTPIGRYGGALSAVRPDDLVVTVIDALVDWPEPSVWSVGMLLLDPDHRGTGLGTATLEAFEGWAKGEGAAKIRTAVV